MQLGKMYLVKEYCWFLYPTKELAWDEGTDSSGRPRRAYAVQGAKWYSEHYKCNVFVVEPKTYVVLLEVSPTISSL